MPASASTVPLLQTTVHADQACLPVAKKKQQASSLSEELEHIAPPGLLPAGSTLVLHRRERICALLSGRTQRNAHPPLEAVCLSPQEFSLFLSLLSAYQQAQSYSAFSAFSALRRYLPASQKCMKKAIWVLRKKLLVLGLDCTTVVGYGYCLRMAQPWQEPPRCVSGIQASSCLFALKPGSDANYLWHEPTGLLAYVSSMEDTSTFRLLAAERFRPHEQPLLLALLESYSSDAYASFEAMLARYLGDTKPLTDQGITFYRQVYEQQSRQRKRIQTALSGMRGRLKSLHLTARHLPEVGYELKPLEEAEQRAEAAC